VKAVRFHSLGGPEVLTYEDAPDPACGDGEVLVRVKAAGANFADTMFTQGRYYLRPTFPAVPGLEVAGEVSAISGGVDDLAIGDRVMAVLAKAGGYAEIAAARADHVTGVPAGMSFMDAACLPIQAVTADQLLHVAARVRAGEWVVVHAAAGGTGSFLVQMAKIAGARVIATASDSAKLDLAFGLGAEVLVNYTRPEWPREVKAATGGRGADVIIDGVGGDVFSGSLECLGPFGRLVVMGQSGGPPPTLNPLRLMRQNQAVVGYYLMTAMDEADLMRATSERIAAALSGGSLKVVIGETAPLSAAAEVHRRILARETTGKVVLVVAS